MTETEEEHEFMGVEWEVEVRDKDGNITDSKKGKNSLLNGMAYELLWGFNQAVTDYPYDITNAQVLPTWYGVASSCGMDINGAAGDVVHGIMIGTNNTAVVATDYKMGTLIANGIGAGQMQYLITTCNAVVNASPRSNLRVDRVFTNGSPGAITVKELGMYVLISAAKTICICRDVIADTAVAAGSSLFVKYTIYITI